MFGLGCGWLTSVMFREVMFRPVCCWHVSHTLTAPTSVSLVSSLPALLCVVIVLLQREHAGPGESESFTLTSCEPVWMTGQFVFVVPHCWLDEPTLADEEKEAAGSSLLKAFLYFCWMFIILFLFLKSFCFFLRLGLHFPGVACSNATFSRSIGSSSGMHLIQNYK